MNAQNLKLYIKAITDFSDVQSNVKNVQQVLERLKLPDNLKKNFTGLFTSFEKEAEKYQKFLNSGFKTKKDVTGLEQAGKNIGQILTKIQSQMGSISTSHLKEVFKIDTAALAEAQNIVAEIQKQMSMTTTTNLSKEISDVSSTINKLQAFSKNKELINFEKLFKIGDIEGARQSLERLHTASKKFQEGSKNKDNWDNGVKALRASLQALTADSSLIDLNQRLNQAKINLDNIESVEFTKFVNGFQQGTNAMGQMVEKTKVLNNEQLKTAQNTHKLTSELETLKYQTTYFFGLTNSINLFKRALREAYQTVKELDAAMTATAVVTDFTVSDMWGQLSEYTKRANELGVAVKGAYEAATLYYQQGLKTDQVVAVSNETLKMARIAGMDYAEATDSMTAALRGFNMEVNEISAQKVNDVYSKLAAITASDTQEISTAMSKTASIAASANMEFETTAAFLSQIIETTREAPETAGTALKTVIARFQELKKQPSEIGEVEGEIVDANKIETALRTIDVALRDTNGQFRALDDVFLDIAAKWDDLDTNTQRYIATMAAGSRQQSRFIAMMSDYDRTMELVSAANNSAGASQAQFEKTLDSLESKLAKLDNAWNEFTMGIANNVAIKTGVDLLTLLLNTVNNVTGILPSGVDSITKLGIALLGLRTGLKIFDTFWLNLENKMGPTAAMTNATKTAFAGLGKVFTAKFWVQKGPTELFNQLVKQSPAAIGAIDAETAAAARLGQIYNLNHTQQRAFIAAKKAGVDATIALAMAQDKEALSALENAQAEAVSTGVEKANTNEKIKNIATSFAENKQEQIGQIEKQKGIFLRIADTLAIAGETIAKKLHIKALVTEEGILKASNALKAKAILLTLGTTAAVVGLIFVFKKLYDVMKDNTPEARIKKIRESIEDSEEAAKSAKDAYENLFSAKTEYEDIQDKLDGLVKGTKEWEQALFEANNQVLELINSYDNLQVKNNNGRLEIINWDEILEQQKERIANTTISASIANLELKQEEEAQAKVGIRTSTNSYTEEFRKELIDAFDSGKLAEALAGGVESEAYQEVREEFGLTIFELEELIPTLQNYKNSLTGLTNASDNLANALAANLSEEVKDSDYAINAVKKVAELSEKNYEEQLDATYNTLRKGFGEAELREMYKNLSGSESDSEWDAKKLTEEVAKLQLSNEYLETSENLIKALDELDKTNKETAKAVDGYFSDGNSLTRGDLNIKIDEDLPQLKEIAETLGISIKDLIAGYEESAHIASEQFNKIDEDVKKAVGSAGWGEARYASTNILSDASLGQYEGYMTQLKGIITRGLAESGEEGGKIAGARFNTKIQEILAKAPAEAKDKILNLIGTTDFSTVSGIEQFVKDVQTLGVEIPFDEAKGLTKEFTELANAINDINLSTLIDQIKTLRDIADEIRDSDISEGISEETYNTLLEQNAIDPEEFYWTGQEFIYLGKSMSELADAIEADAASRDEGIIQEYKNRIANADAFENRADSYFETDLGKENFLTGGADLSLIRHLLDLDVENFSNERAQAIYDQAVKDYAERGELQSQLTTKEATITQADMFGMSAVEIQNSNYSEDKQQAALQAIKTYNQLDGEITQINKNIAKENKGLEVSEAQLIDLAKATKTASKEIGELNTSINDNLEVLKSPSSNPADYASAIQEIANKAREAFSNGAIDANFVDSNRQLFIQMAQGGEAGQKAYRELGKKSAIAYFSALGKELSEKDLKELIEANIPEGVEFGVTATFDGTQLAQAFYDILQDAAEVQEVLNSLGYSASLTVLEEVSNPRGDSLGYFSGEELTEKLRRGWTRTGNTKIDTTILNKNSPLGTGYTPKTSGSTSEWENPYDEQYNTLEKINEALRDREELEKDYQLLQKKGIVNGKDALKYYNDIFANLKKQADLQNKLITGRQKELTNLLAENPSMTQYAKYDESSGLIEIQYDLIDAIKKSDEKTGEAVEKFISELERISESIEDAQDELIEIENNQEDIKDQLVDTYLAFEDRVAAALEAIDQKQVDLLQEEFDALTEAEESLADAISKSIDEMRQARENEKTEEEIAEKERRLAYLRQDSTGSNALEIKRLEEEIAEQREGYQDALIDQALTNMQEQNELAAEQRDKQIELMQSQIEYNVETGVYAKQVAGLIESAMEGDHMLTKDDELYDILNDGENWRSLSEQGFKAMFEELATQISEAYAAMNNAFEGSGSGNGSSGSTRQGIMGKMMDLVEENGGIMTPDLIEKILNLNTQRNNKIDSKEYKDAGGKQEKISNSEIIDFLTEWYNNYRDDPTYGDTSPGKISSGGSGSTNTGNAAGAQYAYPHQGDTIQDFTKRHGISASKLKELNPDRVKTTSATAELDPSWKLRIYKTGGLADFTGPAWLDGSKGKPELVLNARDTENFIVLKDVLSSLLHNTPANNSNGGDNYFDITIQVEEISNDYDVDQMAARIKQNIYEDSMYRNVNAVNFLR